ncbi:MAG: DUF5056 domain-containing protein [Bacteroidales bacterium]
MNQTTEDKTLISFFQKNKEEIKDNGFSDLVTKKMKLIEEPPLYPYILSIAGWIALFILFCIYRGWQYIPHVLNFFLVIPSHLQKWFSNISFHEIIRYDSLLYVFIVVIIGLFLLLLYREKYT